MMHDYEAHMYQKPKKPKLLNCPHCDGKPYMNIIKLLDRSKTYQIICSHCGCRSMAFDKTWSKPKAEAIKTWNRRYVYGEPEGKLLEAK